MSDSLCISTPVVKNASPKRVIFLRGFFVPNFVGEGSMQSCIVSLSMWLAGDVDTISDGAVVSSQITP
jgi:hypothetical protein